ncbi:MAG: sensor domain-containing diguanylate cyclase [Gammaproteobacteria bacterium]|nr:sensor domain-containing diguanylate cyclase [Gammaproteobacteria bacterium]MCH9744241.1 sensor domain-containing diguanylate cyclase [Gammaproteobacteria bacterium]
MNINFEEAFQLVPLGLMIIDSNKTVHAWNQWLADKTGIRSDSIMGHKLDELYSEANTPRFNSAIEQVIKNKSQQVMSHILNKFLIPIETEYNRQNEFDHMPQQIYLAPINIGKKTLIMVSIVDVTESVIRTTTLTDMAKKLEEESNKDQLTGAYNRRFLWGWAEQQKKYLERYHYSQSFLLLDIDHFKKINDKLGHQAGDDVLKKFTNTVFDTLRDSDILVRYGGEEFLVILVHADKEVASKIAERIRKNIEKETFHSLKQGEITCSIGVSYWDESNDTFDADRLLREADEALYNAKHNGRNKVSVSNADRSLE